MADVESAFMDRYQLDLKDVYETITLVFEIETKGRDMIWAMVSVTKVLFHNYDWLTSFGRTHI